MPPGSDIILYGWLSQEPSSISNGLIVMHEKRIIYYWAKKYLDYIATSKRYDEQGLFEINEEMTESLTKVKTDLNSGGKIFGIKIACEGGINDFDKLIESSENYAQEGKSIFKFHGNNSYKK